MNSIDIRTLLFRIFVQDASAKNVK